MQTSTLERSIEERLRRGVGVSTAERVRQAGETELDIRVETEKRDGVLSTVVRQRVTQAPLDRLKAKGSITERQFDAGDEFRKDAYEAGMIPSGALVYEPSDRRFGSRTPQFMAASRADAHARWVEAQAILDKLYPIVDEVCWAADRTDTLQSIGARLFAYSTNDRRAETAALTALRLGLDTLADHYRL